MKLLLVEKIDADDPVLVSRSDRRPARVQCPFDSDDLAIRVIQSRDVSKVEFARYLLLKRELGLRQLRSAGERRIDLQLAYTKHPLEPVRHGVRQPLAQQRRFTHLLKTLRWLGWLIRQQS